MIDELNIKLGDHEKHNLILFVIRFWLRYFNIRQHDNIKCQLGSGAFAATEADGRRSVSVRQVWSLAERVVFPSLGPEVLRSDGEFGSDQRRSRDPDAAFGLLGHGMLWYGELRLWLKFSSEPDRCQVKARGWKATAADALLLLLASRSLCVQGLLRDSPAALPLSGG